MIEDSVQIYRKICWKHSIVTPLFHIMTTIWRFMFREQELLHSLADNWILHLL